MKTTNLKLWEALKIHEETGRKIRPMKGFIFERPYHWRSSMFENDLWEVEPATVTITREDLEKAWDKILTDTGFLKASESGRFSDFAKELGL